VLLGVVLPIAIGVLVVLVLASTPWGNEQVRRFVVSQANKRLDGALAIGTLRGNLLSSATLTDVRLADSSHQPVFTARRVQVRYELLPALRGHVVIRSLALDTPFVALDKRPGAKWNFQSLLKPSTTPKDTTQHTPPPELSDITIRHGRFYYRRPWAPDSTLSRASQDSAIASALRLDARRRTERVAGGYQRVLDYHDLDAHLPSVAIGQGGRPTIVQIGALSMLAEPYRPPAIDVRSLIGTLFASKDSLWWRDAHMVLPASKVSGDGTIGFHKSGFRLDLFGAPIAVADLRWLDPKLPVDGGGTLRYTMHLHGDTSDFAVADANVHYREASVVGAGSVSRVSPPGAKSELLIHGADLTIAKLSTAIIHELAPSFAMKRAGTIDGHLAVSGPPRTLQLDADLRFNDLLAGLSRVTARGGVGLENGMHARSLVVGLHPLQVATLAGAGVRLPIAGIVTGDATVSGSARDGWSGKGDLTHVQNGARSHLIGSGAYQTNGKRVTADVALEPLSLATAGRFAPSAQLHGDVTGHVHAEGTTRELALNGSLRSAENGGTIETRGTVSVNGSRSRYDVTATLDALNAFAFSRRAPETQLTGTISARGTGFSPATMNAAATVDLVRSRYDTFAVDRLQARLSAADGLLRVDTLDALASGARASAAGSFGLTATRMGTLRFSAVVDSLGTLRKWIGTSDRGSVDAASGRQRARLVMARADSARRAEAVRIERIALGLPEGVTLAVDSLPPLRRDSLAGRLAANGTLRGNVKELGVDASVRGSGLVVRGTSVRELDATVASANVRDSSSPLRFRLTADSVEASGYAFERVQADGSWRDRQLSADVRVRQDSIISYAMLGRYARPAAGAQTVRLDSLRATFGSLVWRLAHPGAVRIDSAAVALDSLDLRSSSGGRLYANGIVPSTGPVRLDVAAENVRVATVLLAMQRDAVADGIIAASARIEGTRALPLMSGRASLDSATYRETRAPNAAVSFDYRDRRLALDATARDSTGRHVLSATASLPFDLALTSVTGSRRVDGPLVADVVLDSLSLAALPFSSRSVTDLRGKLGAEVHARGSWQTPKYSGQAALRDGALTLVATEMRIADASVDLRLAGDTLHLDSLVARVGGPLRAFGWVDLSRPSQPFVNMTARGTNLRVMDQTRGLVDADAELFAVGPLDALRVTGRGEMKGGFLALKQFRKDLLRVKAPGDLSFLTVFDTTAPRNDSTRIRLARAQPKRVAIIADLSLVVDRGNYYRNRPDANTEFYTGEGEVVRAHIDQRSEDQWAVGFVRIGDGVAFYRTRPFTPAKGSLTFGPHTGAPAIVQQVGERLVWEPGRGWFPLELLTGGTSKAPSVGLESGTIFPIHGRALNGYLTLGRASTSLLQQAGSSLSGSESWSGQLSGESGALAHRQQAATALGVVLHDIGTGFTKEYGFDAFSAGAADMPTELVLGKTGGVRGALIEGGRYLTTDRYVGGELRLTSGIPGFRLAQMFGTAYRLDLGVEPRFLFHAPEELGITHPTVRTGVFGVFLTRMWDF
jgi:translocation and assembly module TamB